MSCTGSSVSCSHPSALHLMVMDGQCCGALTHLSLSHPFAPCLDVMPLAPHLMAMDGC